MHGKYGILEMREIITQRKLDRSKKVYIRKTVMGNASCSSAIELQMGSSTASAGKAEVRKIYV